jgi:hypothetical protein
LNKAVKAKLSMLVNRSPNFSSKLSNFLPNAIFMGNLAYGFVSARQKLA